MSRQAYSSTVHAPVQIALAILTAAAILIVGATVGAPSWPIAAIAAAAVMLTGLHLSTVRVMIGGGQLLLAQGPWGRARTIAADDVVARSSTTLGWAQIFGLGVPFHRMTTRLTVRPGPTLCLTLRSGEYIRVSTRDPDAALRLLSGSSGEDRVDVGPIFQRPDKKGEHGQ